jgi:hypothetical protein
MSAEQTPESAREIMDRLQELTPETHKALFCCNTNKSSNRVG